MTESNFTRLVDIVCHAETLHRLLSGGAVPWPAEMDDEMIRLLREAIDRPPFRAGGAP